MIEFFYTLPTVILWGTGLYTCIALNDIDRGFIFIITGWVMVIYNEVRKLTR